MTHSAGLEENIREVLLRHLQKQARVFQKLRGGRNSQVYRVGCSDGSEFAVKAYFQSTHDRRDRMGCEFRALQFLKGNGLQEVAAPIAMDEERRVAIYEFVKGHALQAGEITEADIHQSVEFLRGLKAIADSATAAHFSAASEACFSIEAILKNIEDRFRRLDEASAKEPALMDFLQNECLPFRELAERSCRDICRDHDIDPGSEITMAERTLSPSDFGFHNALRCAGGRLVFLDFEYFGWDDPAKTVVDFLLHPGMELPHALKQRFFAGMIASFPGVPKLCHRTRAVYTLFGLKWCAILLNEFTLEHMARRRFADGTEGAWNGAFQIEKARRMLAKITNDLGNFPYHP